MPRAHGQRRQAIRHRRRQTRRSLSLLLLDEDFVSPEEWDETSYIDTRAERRTFERLVSLGPAEAEED